MIFCIIRVFTYFIVDIRVYTYYNKIAPERRYKEMPMTPKEMIKLLKQNGFEQISQNGSHVKLRNNQTGKQTIVPLHAKSLKKGLEQAILKQAGLK